MRTLVCGGREFDDIHLLFSVLDAYPQITEIIHGDAKGADFLARCYAKFRGKAERRFPAKWKAYGRAAGPMRNTQMLDEAIPEFVIAFPGDDGTADMVRQSKLRGLPVYEVTP